MLICYSSMQYVAVCYTPIALASITPFVCFVFINTASNEVCHFCLDLLPSFPYTHAYSTSQPFVCFKQETFHTDKVIIPDPTSYVFFQLLLSLDISPSIAATCQFFQPWLHLGFGIWMHRELAFAFHHIKGVTEVFHSSHVWHYDLILVDFEIVRSDVCRRIFQIPTHDGPLAFGYVIPAIRAYWRLAPVRQCSCRAYKQGKAQRGCVKTLLFLKNHKALTFISQGFAMSKSCCNFRP